MEHTNECFNCGRKIVDAPKFTIVLPLSKAVIATMILFYSVSFWNSWFAAFLYMDRSDLYPVTIYLRNLLAGATAGDEGARSPLRGAGASGSASSLGASLTSEAMSERRTIFVVSMPPTWMVK